MKNRKAIGIFFAIFGGLIFCGLIVIWKADEIYGTIKIGMMEMAEQKAYGYRNEALLELSSLPSLEKDTGAWYCKYSIIAHSGG